MEKERGQWVTSEDGVESVVLWQKFFLVLEENKSPRPIHTYNLGPDYHKTNSTI